MPRGASALIAALLLAGCSSATPPSPQNPSGSALAACIAVIDALPDDLDGQRLSSRTPSSATWGQNMTLNCGVTRPAAYRKTSEMIVVNDVAWFAQKQDDGYLFTAVGRQPLVNISVPSTHSPEVNPLVDLAPSMLEQTTISGPAGVVPS